ncbi:MAG: NFACT family protein [Candidatus Altiarchaeota archaeon]|nr:NFACT family protein [Candidatus Altiarchaeota archaeon]
MKKTGLTSFDVYFLVRELGGLLRSGRVDKVYQISERELKVRLRIPVEGSSELVVAPNYLCLSRYPRDVPEQPSSFAMQLRKHLRGSLVREVRQHGFDRIVEFILERGDVSYTLVVELFSKGNVILCDAGWKILGLLEWQKWRDRRLAVGQRYEHPPAGRNPLEVDLAAFLDVLGSSEKIVVSTLATDVGLGGLYAEEVCLRSGVGKEKASGELSDEEKMVLFQEIQKLLDSIEGGVLEPMIVLDEGGGYLDVLPSPLGVYEGCDKKKFPAFNDAVDAYFSEEAFSKRRDEREEKVRERLEKILKIEEKQRETIRRLEEKAVEYQMIGDLIYQKLTALNTLLEAVRGEKKKGAKWSEIRETAAGKSFDGIRFVDVDEGGVITLEVEA